MFNIATIMYVHAATALKYEYVYICMYGCLIVNELRCIAFLLLLLLSHFQYVEMLYDVNQLRSPTQDIQ